MLDARNHGESESNMRHDYLSMALDLKRYLDERGLKKVTLLGQSMGGKTAMTFACLFPKMVDGLISIDSPPVNRNLYPHLNGEIHMMVMPIFSHNSFLFRSRKPLN